MRKLVVLVAAVAALVGAGNAAAHHNTIGGTAECSRGAYTVTWVVENSEYATSHATETITASSRAVVPVGSTFSARYTLFTETVPGTTTSLSLTLSARWSNGVTRTNTGYATGFEQGCEPPPPPVCTEDMPCWDCKTMGNRICGPKAVRKPKAHFRGPCGDPYYVAVLNNKFSNRKVTFRIHTSGGTIVRTVRAGRKVTTKPFYVVGYSAMRITAVGRTLDRQRAAAPGTYPWTACS